jgi:hypothetical protein
MTATQINGATQIRSATITTTQLSASAGITDGQLASSYIYANGTRAMTAALSLGSFQINNVATPSSSTDAATKGYVDGIAQGLNAKYSARAATVGTETYTIASGAVTVISGTTLDGQSPNVGEYILIKDAPASSGTGSVGSSEPANGLYSVTSNTTNLSVTRSADETGSISPAGSYVFIESGSTWAATGWVVSTPNTNAAFTYGTGNIAYTQFSGAGDITVDSTLTKTGNQLSRPAITGDITISTGSNASTIASAAVTLTKMANLAANSVIGNTTGSGATPTAVTLAAAATASSVAYRDANANLTVNSIIEGSQTVTSAAGTTTLTVSSPALTQITGTTTQTVVLPNATTLGNGQSFTITNRSTGIVTVQTNGGATLQTMAAGSQLDATVISNGTSAGTWDSAYSQTTAGGSGTVTSVSVVNANGFNGTVATNTSTPAITISTTITGMLKGNGTAISAATAGTDYLAPSDLVTRETPSGTINGSTTSFTLANTPISGTEMVYQNGLLQDAGGQDYSISTNTITFVTAPVTGDKLRVTYWH